MPVKQLAAPLHYGLFPVALPEGPLDGLVLGMYEYVRTAATNPTPRKTIMATAVRRGIPGCTRLFRRSRRALCAFARLGNPVVAT